MDIKVQQWKGQWNLKNALYCHFICKPSPSKNCSTETFQQLRGIQKWLLQFQGPMRQRPFLVGVLPDASGWKGKHGRGRCWGCRKWQFRKRTRWPWGFGGSSSTTTLSLSPAAVAPLRRLFGVLRVLPRSSCDTGIGKGASGLLAPQMAYFFHLGRRRCQGLASP